MKPIKNFMLPEHTNSLYKNEAISSISLTKDVASKINELVDAYNELRQIDYEREQEQDGKINKAVLFMKDNLLNSLEQLMELLLQDGYIDNRIAIQCRDLNQRLDNLLSVVKAGTTTRDAEIIDARAGILNNTYENLGKAIKEQLRAVVMANTGTYVLKPGTINASDGKFVESETRLLSTLLSVTGFKTLSCDKEYQFKVLYYDADLNYLGATDWLKAFDLKELNNNVLFIRFVIAQKNNELVSVDDIPLMNIVLLKDVEAETDKGIQIKNAPLFNATITTAGVFEYRANRLITKIMKPDFIKIEVNEGYRLKLACYDSNMSVLTSNDFRVGTHTQADLVENTEYIQIIVAKSKDADMLPTENTGLTIYTTNNNLTDKWYGNAPAFKNELLNIAYSNVNLGIANTKMHFDLSARFGFNALKGDVRITSDDVLVMHHDAGVYIDSAGQIADASTGTEYNFLTNAWSSVFKDRTFKERLGYLPAYSQHLCTFEEYVQLCVKHNKIAYITVRENNTAKVIELCMETLKKYNMLERCVFNSYEYEALQMVRKYSSSIPVSLVIQHEALITQTVVEKVACLGNGILTLFYAPSDNLDDMLVNSIELFDYAKEKGVILHMAQVSKYDDYIKCINAGIKGFHLLKPLQEHQVKYQLKFNLDGAQATLLNEDLTATIQPYDNGFTVLNVKKVGSVLEYDDGLPLLLFISENASVQVTTADYRDSYATLPIAYYEMESIMIDTYDFTGNITLTVIL